MTIKNKKEIEKLAELLKQSKYTVCLTGAGVSTASGIPDFRTPGKGIWSKVDPIEVTSINAFRENPSRFYYYYRPRIEEMRSVKPNLAHYSLVQLESSDYLNVLITQNIDNLHQKAGSKNVLEIHGNLSFAICTNCGERISSQQLIEKILFGEMLSNLEEAIEEASKADLFLAIGSSLQVSPANLLPEYGLAQKGNLVIINFMDTPLDHKATMVIKEDIGAFLSEVIRK